MGDRPDATHMVQIAHLSRVQQEVARERVNQEVEWGQQNHDPFRWLAILTEEVGEVAEECCELITPSPELASQRRTALRMRAELIQVAAVAIAFIQSLDRNELNQA